MLPRRAPSAAEGAAISSSSNVSTQSFSFVLRHRARDAWSVRCSKKTAHGERSTDGPVMVLECDLQPDTGPPLALRVEGEDGYVLAGARLDIEEQRRYGTITGYHVASEDGALAAVDLTHEPPRVLSTAADPPLPMAFALTCLIASEPNDRPVL